MMNPVLRLVRNYGVALVILGALIWFPFTGFWLTILTLGLLPSLICNLFLIHLSYLALTRNVALGWLVVPITCYGVWLGWAIWQNTAVFSKKSKLESENHITVPTPQNVTLVFPKDASSAFSNSFADDARRYLDLSVRVFADETELSLPPQKRGWPVRPYCCSSLPPSTPPGDAIVFHRLEAPAPGYSPTHLYRYELTQSSAPDRNSVVGHFNFGRLQAPVWVPVFVAGCVLIDGGPNAGWKCMIGPKFREVWVGETGPTFKYDYDSEPRVIKSLAKMLGVKSIDFRP
jgi:hypothetical protein